MRIILLALIFSGCTDAVYDATIGDIGEQHDVVCYSGGKDIFNAKTTGKVASLKGGG
jgi:hypothetical protein